MDALYLFYYFHSIVAGGAHADGIIAQLEGCLKAGYDLVLTAHYTSESLKDAETKISYLRELKALAEKCGNGKEFKAAVRQSYPNYSGENYLDMTAGSFFASVSQPAGAG